jgi:soluble lytic murein transglycosylase-like protein
MAAELVTQIVRDTSGKYNVDPCLIESIVIYESDLNPNNISTTGAMGLMALMPVTAKKYDLKDPFDPASNVDAGTRLVRDLLETFHGDVNLTLAAYNAGDDAVRRFKSVPLYRETIDYVKFVNEIYQHLKLRSEYMTYGKSSVIPPHATKTLDVDPPTSKINIMCSSPSGSVEPQQ